MTEKKPTLNDVLNAVNDLAGSTAVGFADVQEKLNQHDQRFDQMEQKIESEIRLIKAEISLGLREVKEEIEWSDQRIDQVLKQNHGDINILIEEQEKIKLRLKKLELKNSQVWIGYFK